MLRARCFPPFSAFVLVTTLLAGSVHGERRENSGSLSEVPLPGGLRAALAAIDDRAAPDRSQFLLEFIRRTHQTASSGKHDQRDAALRALLTHLEFAARPNVTYASAARETLPLPLSESIWIDVVFGGRASPKTVVADILRARGPSLFYYGLLSLDDETRAWLAANPDLIRAIAAQHAAGFLVAAPGLRVRAGSVRVPGGELAEPAWEALVGRRVAEPVEFVRAVVADRERRLPYFLSTMAQLTAAQTEYAFNLRSPDASARIDAARRLLAVFERLAPGWTTEERTFWRPASDPALLIAELASDVDGRPMLPGTRRFWTAAFADGDLKVGRDFDVRALIDGDPVDAAWLCEQVFSGDHRRRYPQVLFASRVVRHVAAESALGALEAVRAAGRFPALVVALERANIHDVVVFANAARHAARLARIDDDGRAARSLAQFQGMLAIVTRAALRGGVPAGELPGLVSSLSAVKLNARGEYEGRMVRWLDAVLREMSPAGEPDEEGAGPVERDLLQLVAGRPSGPSQFVDWEGTRYRVDLRRAEALRLVRLLGDDARPYLSSARAVLDAADALAESGLTRERLARERDALLQVAQAVGGESAAALQRLVRGVDVRSAGRLAAALRPLADALFAQGVLEFTYATALGQPDRAAIAAGDAASRHNFGLGLRAMRRSAPWRLPAAGVGVERDWRVIGSLLGLDVKLAEFSLIALSSRPPARRPTVSDEDRRVFIEAVALVEAASLTNTDRDTIVAAIRAGRVRLAGIRSAADAAAIAEEIRLSSARRNLLVWTAAHDPASLPAFLSPGELLALGSAAIPAGTALHAWGAPAEPRLGCLCLQLLDRSGEILAGRWNSGILASGFPDLNLRLAELLSDLRMPAALLPPVLASATLDFINTAETRDQDDRRGLVDFVQRLRTERVEQYLALLTSDGPLVPMTDTNPGGPR